MNTEQLSKVMERAMGKLSNKVATLEVDLSLAHAQVEIQQEQINSLVQELNELKKEKEKEEEVEKEETL